MGKFPTCRRRKSRRSFSRNFCNPKEGARVLPRRKLHALIIAATVVIFSFGQATSIAEPNSAGKDFGSRSTGLQVTTALPGVIEPRAMAVGSKTLPYAQQVQEWNQWCWAADGASISTYLGHRIAQTDYCKLVHNAARGKPCPNESASLEEIANAFKKIGFNASVGSPFSMTKIAAEISANRPILTGIAWAAGGGHAQVVYGYDADAGTITYGDPWPTSRRIVTQTLASYTQNSEWAWFGEDYGITKNK
ncbi:papain-like cysteine protease family protein [Nocardia sp. NPDC046473]|uniref:papain-like cysteine protease family protein n=1 Tax=Nocardia sp. NPDC046473 TaxID=3155733 RepID=UPI0033DDE8F3